MAVTTEYGRVYSSHQIAKQCRENINVMWLAGNQTPDFRTINKFRGEKLKDAIEEIFISTVKLLNIKGFVSLEKYFVDGTKVESASNKYTFVWKKAVEKNTKKQTRHSMEETAIQKQMKTPLLCAWKKMQCSTFRNKYFIFPLNLIIKSQPWVPHKTLFHI